jgi:hypothetical protein
MVVKEKISEVFRYYLFIVGSSGGISAAPTIVGAPRVFRTLAPRERWGIAVTMMV